MKFYGSIAAFLFYFLFWKKKEIKEIGSSLEVPYYLKFKL